MSGPKLCPLCNHALSPSAPEGLCSKCLWASLLNPVEEDPEPENAPLSVSDSPANSLGVCGDYALLDEIARGGMGVVYRARQISLQRVVALKMILTTRLPGEADMKRFRAEAEAIASLEHPNIVPVHEVGEDEGRPFFTMKYVPGGSLAQRISSGEFELANDAPARRESQIDIATLVTKVARAIHYAHQRGILHRDLKPSNILMDARGEPLVTDFGLAKQIETDSNLTLSGAVLGTPAYISPEQAAGGKSLTTAVDVYSLGAIFYELLTGRPPFTGATVMEILQKVLYEEPVPPRLVGAINRTERGCVAEISRSRWKWSSAWKVLKGQCLLICCGWSGATQPRSVPSRDLETICLKCLSKQPDQRYGSAEALAEDLDRWLRHEPIRARRSSLWERSRKWTMRHPASTALIIFAVITPIAIIFSLLSSNSRVRKAEFRTRENLYAADMFLADRALREGNLGLAREALAKHIPPTSPANSDDFRGFEWRLLWKRSQGDHLQSLAGFPQTPISIAVAPNGKTVAIGGQDFLWRWNVDEKAGTQLLPPKEPRWLDPVEAAKVLARVRMTPFLPHQVAPTNPTPNEISLWVNPERTSTVTGLSFSSDGRLVVTSTRKEFRAVRIWNIADGRIEFAFPANFSSAVMSPVAPIVAVGSCEGEECAGTGCVKLYDFEARAEIWSLPSTGGLIAFSGDGQLLATADWNNSTSTGRLSLWSLPERRLLKEFFSKTICYVLAFSPDARWIAVAQQRSPVIELWRVDQKQPVRELVAHTGAVRALAFSPDSQLLATAGVDQIIRLWSVSSATLKATRLGHTDEIASLSFFPDGNSLASAARDATVRIWSANENTSEMPAPVSYGISGRIMVSPDSRFWTSTKNLKIWEPHTESQPRTFDPGSAKAQNEGFDDAGRTIVSSMASISNALIDLEWRKVEDLSVTRRLSLGEASDSAFLHTRSFCPSAGLFAIGQSDGLVRVWSTRTGRLLHNFGMPDHVHERERFTNVVNNVVFSPDGTLLAAGILGYSQIGVFSVPEDKLLYSHHARPLTFLGDHRKDAGNLRFLDFSPDGKLLVSTDATEKGIRIWEARTGRALGQISGHRDHTVTVAFSPDGKTLASTGGDGSLKLWHLSTRREMATLLESGATGPVAFSPDGSMLLAGLQDQVRIYRVPTLLELDRKP